MSLKRATVIFFFSNLCLHAILGESDQILSSHYMWYMISCVLTSGVCYLYVCICLLIHDCSDVGSCRSVVACLPIEACVCYDGYTWLVCPMCICSCGVVAYSLSGLCAWDWVVRGWVTLVVVGGDYYYSCMCSLYARIYFSLYDGSEGELVSYVSRLLVCIKVMYFCTLGWCVFVKFVAKKGE